MIKWVSPRVKNVVKNGGWINTYIRTRTTATVKAYHTHSSTRRADMAAAAAAANVGVCRCDAERSSIFKGKEKNKVWTSDEVGMSAFLGPSSRPPSRSGCGAHPPGSGPLLLRRRKLDGDFDGALQIPRTCSPQYHVKQPVRSFHCYLCSPSSEAPTGAISKGPSLRNWLGDHSGYAGCRVGNAPRREIVGLHRPGWSHALEHAFRSSTAP